MSFRKIKAVVNKASKDKLIEVLKNSDTNGFHYYKVKGLGEFLPVDSKELPKSYCFEVYTSTSCSDKIKKLIVETVQTGGFGDGFIAISPVEELIKIRNSSGESFSSEGIL